ncbi:MAG: HMA2 domain-containing protein [Acidobacteriota bacterium]
MTGRWLAVAHELPERTRLRTPILRKDVAACERVADALSALGGVREVRVRPYTGSVLVTHADDVTAKLLVEVVARELGNPRVLAPGERPPVEGEAPPLASLARKLVHAIREIDEDVRRATDGTVDLGTLTTLGFVGAGAVDVARSGELPLPPWFQLAWWGFRTFVTTEQEEIRAECDGRPCAPDPAAGT